MDVPIAQVAPKAFLRLLHFIGEIVPAILHQRILFVGSPCVDGSTIGFLPHVNRREALFSLQLALEKKAKECGAALIVWKDFPETFFADLEWLSHKRRLSRVVSFPGTLAELPSQRKEDYYATMKGSDRRNLQRKLRRSREQVALNIEIIQRPDTKTLDEIFALFWQTYQKSTTKFERLNRTFFESIATKRNTEFVVLREKATGEIVAFHLCLDMGKRLVNRYIGLDYSRPKEWMLYFRVWEATVDLALLRGLPTIWSGQLSYTTKLELGHRLVPLNNYCGHRNIVLHHLYRMLAQRVDWTSLDDGLAHFLKAHPAEANGQTNDSHPEMRTTRRPPRLVRPLKSLFLQTKVWYRSVRPLRKPTQV
ncbi:MAG TPA: GNAT family N-acetyltransferase [Chthoniobacterales bacterium]|nr:GNAT family N-acetyltransferase [Chthoniobacterales bacterium]